MTDSNYPHYGQRMVIDAKAKLKISSGQATFITPKPSDPVELYDGNGDGWGVQRKNGVARLYLLNGHVQTTIQTMKCSKKDSFTVQVVGDSLRMVMDKSNG